MQLLAANCLFLSETRRIPRTAADPYSPVSILASIAAPNLGQSDHITGLKPTKFNHRQGLVLFSSHRGGTKKLFCLHFPRSHSLSSRSFRVYSHARISSEDIFFCCNFCVLVWRSYCLRGRSGSSPLDRLRTYAEERIQVAVERVDPLGVRLQVEPVHLDHVPLVAHAGVAEGDLREFKGFW